MTVHITLPYESVIVFLPPEPEKNSSSTTGEEGQEVGGLFKVTRKSRSAIDDVDSTRMLLETDKDWSLEEVSELY